MDPVRPAPGALFGQGTHPVVVGPARFYLGVQEAAHPPRGLPHLLEKRKERSSGNPGASPDLVAQSTCKRFVTAASCIGDDLPLEVGEFAKHLEALFHHGQDLGRIYGFCGPD